MADSARVHQRGEAQQGARATVHLHMREVDEHVGFGVARVEHAGEVRMERRMMERSSSRHAAARTSTGATGRRLERRHHVREQNDEPPAYVGRHGGE